MAFCETIKAEDCVECFFFPIDEAGRPPSDWDALEALRTEIQEFASSLSSGYIWHKDELKFQKRISNGGVSLDETEADLPSHIYAVCQFGDNVEDEWFVVYIAKEISNKFPNVVVRVVDADGEFLLIEAANSLPSWAEPKNTANRVFFHRGSLLLIPPKNNEAEEEIAVEEALKEIARSRNTCLASNDVVEDILLRIENYPDKIEESFHTVTAYVPVGVAALLNEDKRLISSAVHAFCARDPIDMKACRAMRYFPPENRVNASIKFTKCLYAMLAHNNFYPDRRTGWNLPLANSPQHKSHSLGVKLACGFEILVSQAKPSDDFESSKSWDGYLESLKKRGYFRELLEGSQLYNGLLENAKEYYLNNLHSMKSTPAIGSKILTLLGSINTDVQFYRKLEPSLPKDDDESWLCVDPKELEAMLQKRYGQKNFSSLNGLTDASQMSSKVNEFLEHMSGVDGAEFPNQSENSTSQQNEMPVRPKRGIKAKKNGKSDAPSRSPSLARKYKMDFDADQFSTAIQNILDLVIPEDKWVSDSDSELSEYGSDRDVGADFELSSNENRPKKTNVFEEYMKQMDCELAATSVGRSFECKKPDGTLDVDKNAMANIRESFVGEAGGTGPAGNLLGPLGFAKFEEVDSIDEESD